MNCSPSGQILGTIGVISKNDSLTETAVDQELLSRLRIAFSAYVVIGIVLLLTNTPIVAAVLFHRVKLLPPRFLNH